MKFKILILSTLTMTPFLFMACSKPLTVNIEAPQAIATTTAEDTSPANAETSGSVAKESNEKCVGGDPGQIGVHGILVKKEAGRNLLDSRIKLKQSTGLSDSDVSVDKIRTPKNKIVLSNDIEVNYLAKLTANNTYINFGCKLSQKLITGLTEVKSEVIVKKDKSMITAEAATIFICGAQESSQVLFSLKADEIIMKDANINIKNFTGIVSISAYKLQLFGKNTVKTEGTALGNTFFPASPILLNVTQTLFGEGTLSLITAGGSCP